MIGVCIPAHNEEDHIDRCLATVLRAARHAGLAGEPVRVVVVLDACTDTTAERVKAWPVSALSVNVRNVGQARASGARHLIAAGARWLAFTDADTIVSPAWLVDQLSLGAQVVCGTVGVMHWHAHGVHAPQARAAFLATYQDRDGHRHVHGANLGIDASVYERLGGFDPLACSEDRGFVEKSEKAGVSIAWSALPRVTTSARPFSRVSAGFADTLRQAWEALE
ncbi:glycosyltransferase [Pandoraea sputorum]|uniref:glycosyltransferase n=1 Tax=Pandoraea sputorum TaxID=93222 RepID=UPI0012420D0D|nr:glycosyltransferase [Pandoraea sputorum]VVE59432.1 glycosyl transferase [Pandoraea sputorum]